MGFFNDVFPAKTFMDEVLERARLMASTVSPRSALTVKRQLYGRLLESDVGEAVERGRHLIAEHFRHPDVKEALVAMLERRTPAFAPLAADATGPEL